MGKMVRMLSLAMVVGVMAQARSQAQTQLFLGDYSGSQVVRFSGDTPDTDVPGGNFSLSGHDEGMGGYSTGSGTSKVNHLLVGVTGSPNNSIQDWVVSFPTGQTLVNSINLDGHGALQISVANDGKSIYAAEGSYGIVQYSIVGGTYGNVLAHTYVTGPGGADANVWGVAVNPITGQVIASANWSSTAMLSMLASTSTTRTSPVSRHSSPTTIMGSPTAWESPTRPTEKAFTWSMAETRHPRLRMRSCCTTRPLEATSQRSRLPRVLWIIPSSPPSVPTAIFMSATRRGTVS